MSSQVLHALPRILRLSTYDRSPEQARRNSGADTFESTWFPEGKCVAGGRDFSNRAAGEPPSNRNHCGFGRMRSDSRRWSGERIWGAMGQPEPRAEGRPAGVVPASWIPHHMGERSPRCRRVTPCIRRSSAGGGATQAPAEPVPARSQCRSWPAPAQPPLPNRRVRKAQALLERTH